MSLAKALQTLAAPIGLASNFFIPGSGAFVSTGLSTLGAALDQPQQEERQIQTPGKIMPGVVKPQQDVGPTSNPSLQILNAVAQPLLQMQQANSQPFQTTQQNLKQTTQNNQSNGQPGNQSNNLLSMSGPLYQGLFNLMSG
jgi:hypothetical protein